MSKRNTYTAREVFLIYVYEVWSHMLPDEVSYFFSVFFIRALYFHFLSTPSQPRRVRMTQRLITPIIHCFTFFLIPSLLHLPFSLFALLIIPFSLFHSFKKTKSFSLCLFCEKKEGGRWGSSNRDIRFRRIYQS